MINSMTLTTYTHPFFSMAIGVALTLAAPVFAQNNKATADAKCPAVLQHTVERLQDEKPQNLCQYAGQVVVADGSDRAAIQIERVLTNDPMMGVFRHADAGDLGSAASPGIPPQPSAARVPSTLSRGL